MKASPPPAANSLPSADWQGLRGAKAATPGSGMRVPKTAEIVAGHIRRRIVLGQLREGDFLPPEGQLIATLGISRPTLREAFRILEAESLISVMRGSRTGARVHQPRVETVARHAGFALQAQGTTIADLYEARLAIEPYLVAKLTRAMPEGAVERLRAEAERLRALVEVKQFVACMIALADFHRLLAELAGNRTLLLITSMLQELAKTHQDDFFEDHKLPEDEQQRRLISGINSFHKLINLIEAGDAEGAETHWRLHIANANTYWVPPADANKRLKVPD